MVVSIEPLVSLNGVYPWLQATGKFGLDDSVLITDDGHEIPTSESILSRDLFVA